MSEKKKEAGGSRVVKFKTNYDYVWPSRAMTAYKAGWSGRVKKEVADAAERAGVLDLPTKTDYTESN